MDPLVKALIEKYKLSQREATQMASTMTPQAMTPEAQRIAYYKSTMAALQAGKPVPAEALHYVNQVHAARPGYSVPYSPPVASPHAPGEPPTDEDALLRSPGPLNMQTAPELAGQVAYDNAIPLSKVIGGEGAGAFLRGIGTGANPAAMEYPEFTVKKLMDLYGLSASDAAKQYTYMKTGVKQK